MVVIGIVTLTLQISGLCIILYSLAAEVNQNPLVPLQVNQKTVAVLHFNTDGYSAGDGIEILSKTVIFKLKKRIV